jgi:aspartyl-tRNA(Asn)/glutamyl-tRNA(Gln) amidotransferase subunit B
LAELIDTAQLGEINQNTAKTVLAEMLTSGKSASAIIKDRGLAQVSDNDFIANVVKEVLDQYPAELASFKSGKEALANWFFGQAMRAAGGKANPAVLRAELEKQLRQ